MSRMHTIPNSWLDAAAIRLALRAVEEYRRWTQQRKAGKTSAEAIAQLFQKD